MIEDGTRLDDIYNDKERYVQQMFSSIANRYDLNNTILSAGLHHYWKRFAVDKASLREGDRVIDICSGTADIAILAAKRVGEKGHVIALDMNREMLSIGIGKIHGEGLRENIAPFIGNAERLNFQDNSFDAALVGFGIRNVNEIDRAFREIRRVLKPGGRGVCLEFSRATSFILRKIYSVYSFKVLPWIGTWVSRDRTGVYKYLPDSIKRFPSQDELKTIMIEAGFSKVEYFNLTNGIVAVHIGVK